MRTTKTSNDLPQTIGTLIVGLSAAAMLTALVFGHAQPSLKSIEVWVLVGVCMQAGRALSSAHR